MSRMFCRRLVFVLGILLASLSAAAQGGETRVAVAANFLQPAKEIAAAFERASGHRAMLSFGASGAFYTQIAQGAPFEIFLSADAERPQKAEQAGLAVRGTRHSYATGRLVLYSASPGLVDPRGAVLRRGNFATIAIADPVTAPYGAAAVQTMQRLGLFSALAPRIVKGSSIAQAFQFVSTGAADLGFVSASQLAGKSGGSRWIVPKALHDPIDQQAVLLKTGARNPAAIAFLKFLRSRQAKAIIRRYGYEVR